MVSAFALVARIAISKSGGNDRGTCRSLSNSKGSALSPLSSPLWLTVCSPLQALVECSPTRTSPHAPSLRLCAHPARATLVAAVGYELNEKAGRSINEFECESLWQRVSSRALQFEHGALQFEHGCDPSPRWHILFSTAVRVRINLSSRVSRAPATGRASQGVW